MAIRGGYYNSIKGDRKYNAETISAYFEGLFRRGVLQNFGGKFVVRASEGMKVIVPTGKAYFLDGKWIENTAEITFMLDPSDVILNRIDSIVLVNNKNEAHRKPDIVLKKGTPAANPVAPGINYEDRNVEEMLICNISVPRLTEEITQANITNTIPNSDVCGYVTGLIDQVDTSELYKQYETAYKEFQDESKEEFENWFNEVKDSLATTTIIRTFKNTYTTQHDSEKTIPIGIPQYRQAIDILDVYTNGLRLNGMEYTINRDRITLLRTVDVGTQIEFVVYKSIDGSDAEDMLDQVGHLEGRVYNLEKTEETLYVYKCTGTDDNFALSELAQDFLLGEGRYNGVNAYAEMVVKVNGTLGLSSVVAGSGNAEDPFTWFAIGKYKNRNTLKDSTESTRKITFDFTNCNRISVGSDTGHKTVLFAGNEVNITGLQAIIGGDGSSLAWFNGENIRVVDCMLYMNASGIAIGSESGGTFERCRLSVTSTVGKANALVSDGTTPLKAIDCYIMAYNATGVTDESVCVLATANATESVVIVERCNMPLVSRAGYKQSQMIKINSGYCSLVSNILGKEPLKYSTEKCTEIGTMIINKQI